MSLPEGAACNRDQLKNRVKQCIKFYLSMMTKNSVGC